MFSFLWKKRKPETGVLNSSSGLESFAVAITDVGEVRKNNEDSILFTKPHDKAVYNTKGSLAIVCDGMGGHNAGELASKIAVHKIPKYYYESNAPIREAIRDALVEAHNEIIRMAKRNPKHEKMGTTCTAAVILNKTLHIGHVGDSRAYLVSNHSVKLLTEDNTYVQHLYKQGVITADERDNHPDRNIVTMVLGTQNVFIPSVYSFQNVLDEQHKLLLCSDGLYEYIKESELLKIMAENSSLDAAEKFIDMAKMRGGHDNISVIIIENKKRSEKVEGKITKQIN